MHELGLARNIVGIVGDHARGRRVSRVRLVVGPHACVEEEAVRFCFDVVSEQTVLAGARLEFLPGEGDAFVIKDFDMEEMV
ncbi:hydrogenase maturation nickel metallochaperone HypA [Hankyongella ginsenosidimutans]|uniref:Hydrogenase maturation nickel metallochaperone HypA n=1 Tax=Hankyongella ginsenosidimutans TaxID=1763828 RepID=A0A4D7C2C7_9SPHN|nr:hydrogenase/urease maturation nickel metallochaperone HypA [Hankyongella ginsenosidimutans]QCI79844.1 hydrogenase maturation nickel metallochaperone HypA [Hankyongella ginsenosidimutans]